jgi:hypothetical protein
LLSSEEEDSSVTSPTSEIAFLTLPI